MSVLSRIVKSAARRLWSRAVARVGGRFVAGMADTSADAPAASFTPKRNLYEQMKQGRAADKDGHDHDHSHR